MGACNYHSADIPEQFRERFIHSGYRPPRSTGLQCVLSLFRKNNETLNVWTQFLPGCYVLWTLSTLTHSSDFRYDDYACPLVCYLVLCCVFLLTSAVAHTFNVLSATARHVCFFFDYLGLSLFSFGVALSYHAYCFPTALLESGVQNVYLNLAAVLSCACTTFSCLTRFMHPGALRQCLRLVAFALPCTFDSVPIVYRLLLSKEASELSLHSQAFFARHYAFLVLAALLYASNVPERLWPGFFDIFGHSHQLFHVASVVGLFYQLRAVLHDKAERNALVKPWTTVDAFTVIAFVAAVFVVNFLITVTFSLYMYKKSLFSTSAAFKSGKTKHF